MTREETEEIKTFFREETQGLRSDVHLEMEAATEEMKRHFQVVAEGLRSEIRLLAEGQVGLREEFHREIAEFRAEVREEFKEVRAMIPLKTRLDQVERSQG